MALATHRTVVNRGPDTRETYALGETGGYPGMLFKLNSSGNAIKHNIVEGQGPLMIGLENALEGDNVATVFDNGELREFMFPGKGAVVNVLVKSGETVSIGTKLCSGGDGTFIVAEAATSGTLVNAVMLECIEGQASALSANTLVAARVI